MRPCLSGFRGPIHVVRLLDKSMLTKTRRSSRPSGAQPISSTARESARKIGFYRPQPMPFPFDYPVYPDRCRHVLIFQGVSRSSRNLITRHRAPSLGPSLSFPLRALVTIKPNSRRSDLISLITPASHPCRYCCPLFPVRTGFCLIRVRFRMNFPLTGSSSVSFFFLNDSSISGIFFYNYFVIFKYLIIVSFVVSRNLVFLFLQGRFYFRKVTRFVILRQVLRTCSVSYGI